MKTIMKPLLTALSLSLLASQAQSQGLEGIPVLGDLVGGNMLSGGIPIVGDLLGGGALAGGLGGLEGANPLAFGPILENDLFANLLIGNLITGSLAGDLVPVSTVFLYDPLGLPDYFLSGGTVLAPVIDLLPPIPVLTAPLGF